MPSDMRERAERALLQTDREIPTNAIDAIAAELQAVHDKARREALEEAETFCMERAALCLRMPKPYDTDGKR